MRYYKLMYDYEHDSEYVGCSKGNIGNISEYIVSNGVTISSWDKEVTFEYDSNEGSIFTDYIANVYGWLIMSDRFRKLSEPLIGDAVQYLAINIKNVNDGSVKGEYQVANVVDVIDAIDLKNSVYDEFDLDDEKIISVEKYALKSSEIKGHHMFKLKDDTIPTFISEKIKRIIEENELKGFNFLEVEVI